MTNPIIFDLKYTPYQLKAKTTNAERMKHQSERAFFDLTGGKNAFDYITTEEKINGEKTALDYLQKNMGVFNQQGVIPSDEVENMKQRAKNNTGQIWHGFISLCEEDSSKIDTTEKCIELVKRTFGPFFKEGNFNEKNMDLMCALHKDKPHHLHIHFVFWEKEAKYYDKQGNRVYRSKGKVDKKAIDNVYVRIAEFLSTEKKEIYARRDEAIKKLRGLVTFRKINQGNEEILEEVIALSKALPKTGRLSYGSKEMEPMRGRVDSIVKKLIDNNGQASCADRQFYEALEKKKQFVREVCRQSHRYSDKNSKIEEVSDETKFRYDIDEKNITLIEEQEADYKRRQGNLVINLAKIIKPEYYERSKTMKYKTNSLQLKRRMTISKRKVKRMFDEFLSSFGSESSLLERDFSKRLQEIEEEIKCERESENKKEENENS